VFVVSQDVAHAA